MIMVQPISFYSLMAKHGCIVCKAHFDRYTWATIHHIQDGVRKKWAVIPLCPAHHQGKRVYGKRDEDNPLSIHRDKSRFREKYGHEWTLFMRLRSALIKVGSWPDEIEESFIFYIENGLAPKILKQAFEDEKIINNKNTALEDISTQSKSSPKYPSWSFQRFKGWILSVTGGEI